MNLGKLVIKYLAVPATSAPSERIWSRAARVLTVKRNRMKEDVTAAMMYCRENKHILHKHFTKIGKERMHEGDHHLIVKHKALLPTFEDEDDDKMEKAMMEMAKGTDAILDAMDKQYKAMLKAVEACTKEIKAMKDTGAGKMQQMEKSLIGLQIKIMYR